jgi:hypothetical protein
MSNIPAELKTSDFFQYLLSVLQECFSPTLNPNLSNSEVNKAIETS